MVSYILKRLAATLPFMVVVALIVFSLLYLAPGDPAAVIAGDMASAAEIAANRTKLQLDDPFWVKPVAWVRQVAGGDLGVSIFSSLPVSLLIRQRLEPTIALAVLTMLVAIAIAVPLGVLAAARSGRWIDQFVMAFAVLGFSAPVFVLGYGLIWLFAIELQWLPVQGYRPIADGIGQLLQSLALPAITLGFTYTALIARITRATMLEVLAQDYIRAARAKGLAGGTILAPMH